MHQIILYIFYTINSVLIVNFLALNSFMSSSYTIFTASILSFSFSYFYKHYFQKWNPIWSFMPLIIDYMITTYITSMVFNPILPSLFVGIVSSYFEYARSNVKYFMLILIGAAIISFYFYPNNQIKKIKNTLASHNINNYNFISQFNDTLKIPAKKCLTIETYSKKCGQCIEAMKDLKDFFDNMERNYNFKHEYIFIGKMTPKDIQALRDLEVINTDTLYQDSEKLFYLQSKMVGYPYFNFYDTSGIYLSSVEGYKKEFQSLYEKEMEARIKCHCTK